MGIAEFVTSPVIAEVEVALGAAFLIAGLVNRKWLWPSFSIGVPSLIYYATGLIPGIVEYPIYYFLVLLVALSLMVKSLDLRHKFTGKAFFLLTAICAILAVVTTYVQLSPDGLDASLLGLVFVLSWWALDGLVIWMAINGDFNGNGADPC